jgi:hypothetical protein
MKPDGQKLSDKISDALIKQFPGSNPSIIEVTDKTFKYQLERNDNYSYFQIEYSIDPSGNLMVSWKNAEPFML